MLEPSRLMLKYFDRCCVRALFLFLLLSLAARSAGAQTWNWSVERVDSGAKFTSLAVDGRGSVHVSYTDNTSHVVKYAFRSVESSRWYTLVIDKNLGNATTRLALDFAVNPHICYPDSADINSAYVNGKRWINPEITPGAPNE